MAARVGGSCGRWRWESAAALGQEGGRELAQEREREGEISLEAILS